MSGGARRSRARCVAVAYSGGRDSTALLHAALRAAAPLGLNVLALHVHHGLQPHAGAWLEHARRRCRRWAAAGAPLAFAHERLAGEPSAGESVEAWARRERYAALGRMANAHGASIVLLAHHRRDQAETWLLQALRGAGAAGLAAMPREAVRDGLVWARPWLDMPRTSIDAYLQRHRLRFVDDPSNTADRFARSRLRERVWPALERAFPDAETALAAAARRAQTERAALDAFAAATLEAATDGDALLLERWRTFGPAQRDVVLRAWLRERLGRGASETLVERLLSELDASGAARWPAGEGAELRRYRGRLEVRAALSTHATPPATALCIDGPGSYEVAAWRGSLRAVPVASGGIAARALRHCELRVRSGAERFRAAANRPARSLKKQFQAAGIAPWLRDGPLVYCDGKLVFVPGLGVAADALAQAGEPQLQLEWLAGEPSRAAARGR